MVNSICSIDSCTNQIHARGWCNKHYKRWRKYGDPIKSRQPMYTCSIDGCRNDHDARGYCSKHYYHWAKENLDKELCTVESCQSKQKALGLCSRHHSAHRRENLEKCSIEGCESRADSRGWCSKHYWRYRTYGDPNVVSEIYTKSPKESFALRSEQQGNCFVWTGSKNKTGYGFIAVGGGRTEYVHRFAWEQAVGPIPEGMHVDHTCWNRLCVNLDHLRLVTQMQNNWNRSGPTKESASGFRNVYPHGNRWRVEIGRNYQQHSFGVYESVEEAAAVAEQARKDLFGDYAGRG